MGIIDKTKKAAVVVGTVGTAYELAVKVTGAPIRKRDEPAAVRIFGIPVFERDESLDRYWFGFIPRGKSRAAKAALAAREGK